MLSKRRLWVIFLCLLSLSLLSQQKGDAHSQPSIIILEPGQGSAVTPPIHIAAQISPGGDNLIRVTLIDQQNNLIARKLLRVGDQQAPLHFTTDLLFEIPKESTPALLTIAIQDEHHRLQSLRSVPLMLQSTGRASIESPTNTAAWLTIEAPLPGETLSGGGFTVSGRITPPNDHPVMFDLVTESGSIVGTSQLSVPTPGETFEFQITLSYDFITSERDVRLIIRQRSDEFATDAILDSLPIILAP